MKKVISIMAAVLMMAMPLFAQNSGDKDNTEKNNWQDKMKAEKIGFLTSEIGLTSDEAQDFWPVYNKYQEERMESFKNAMKSYRALDAAIAAGKSDSEITSLLKEYIEDGGKTQEVDEKYLSQFMKVLPASKVAKVYMAEEKFRRNQIHRLGRGGNPQQQRMQQGAQGQEQQNQPQEQPQGQQEQN
jgi:hypothetical protein